MSHTVFPSTTSFNRTGFAVFAHHLLVLIGGLLVTTTSTLVMGCGMLIGRMEHQAFAPRHVIAAAKEQKIPDFSSLEAGGGSIKVSVRPDIDAERPQVFQLGVFASCKPLDPRPDALSVTQIRWTTLRGEAGGKAEMMLDEPLVMPVTPRNGLGGPVHLVCPLAYPAPAGVTAVDLVVEYDLVYPGRRESRTERNRLLPFEVSFPVPLR